jgi:hypothetical protein
MRNTKVQLLTSIAAVIRKYKKKYCTASQEKLIELLTEFHDVSIQRRQLNYHLADLRRYGLIKTIRRTHRNKDGTLCLETSATCITPAGYWQLWMMGSEWAKKMYEKIVKKYIPNLAKIIGKKDKVNKGQFEKVRDLGRKIFKTPEYIKAFTDN